MGQQEALLFFSSPATGQALVTQQGTGWRKPQTAAKGANIPVGKQRKTKKRSRGTQASACWTTSVIAMRTALGRGAEPPRDRAGRGALRR